MNLVTMFVSLKRSVWVLLIGVTFSSAYAQDVDGLGFAEPGTVARLVQY
jgi:hypothetical protein